VSNLENARGEGQTMKVDEEEDRWDGERRGEGGREDGWMDGWRKKKE